MKIAQLDGRQRTKQAVIGKLARDLGFPEYFGGNLDALFDALTVDVEGPVSITWRATPAARAYMGSDFRKLCEVLEKAAEERPDLDVTIS